MPLPGDVDVVLASELMEAGRAVQRGLVTPDRTTLIASTHRVYAMTEKMAMGDGRADSQNLLAHGEAAAKRFLRFDMEQAAVETGSVISAVLFGALAGSGVLPFSRAQFEATIDRGGVGVKASLKAFAVGFEKATMHDQSVAGASTVAPRLDTPKPVIVPPGEPRDPQIRTLLARAQAEFPPTIQHILIEGLRRLVDYQDAAYAGMYLDRLARLPRGAPADEPLLMETARYLALWMSYEDTIRVADLKTRGSRFSRITSEVKVQSRQLIAINEYMHPRLEEICDTLPAGLGRWLANSGAPRRFVERFTRTGRVVTTTSLGGFLMLYVLAGMKRWRQVSLRYTIENARIQQWLGHIEVAAQFNPQLALEIAQCQRLVKGYGDTHARGWRNFKTVMEHAVRVGTSLAPATLRELREAALADESGLRLRAMLERQHDPVHLHTAIA
jgi:indolepyruvate ferredoxin oxidoreductase, beta subunit